MPLQNLPVELQTLRARYQKGLLAWLKAPESGAGLESMVAALTSAGANAPLWPLALNLLLAISNGQLPPKVEYRRLAGRVDQELRRAGQDEISTDPDLFQEIQDALASLAPPSQPPRIEALIPRGPLDPTLAAAASILPLMAQTREPRFAPEQRQVWDLATQQLAAAWNQRLEQGWPPLRQAIFKLLQGALPLQDAAVLQLAEALASATDILETQTPSLRLLAALTASLELLVEKDFLEHPALTSRVEQLVSRLHQADQHPRSRTLDQLFAREALEEIEHMRRALDDVPPDIEILAGAARQLQRLADPLELATLSLTAYRFSEIVANLEPEMLDQSPTRERALDLVDLLDDWAHTIGTGEFPAAPPEAKLLLAQLENRN